MIRGAEILAALIRVGAAAAVFWLCLQDLPTLVLRDAFEDLPTYDYGVEAERLLAEHRHSEALLVVEAGLSAVPEQREALEGLKSRIEADEAQLWTRLHRVGSGALTGTGDTVEALGGAVVADLFVFGDVRDLVIQSGRGLQGEAVDPVIVGLSAAGLVLTLNPAADLGTALLKFARRVGALGERLGSAVLRAARRATAGDGIDELHAIANNMALLGRRARPAPALRILKHVDDADELRFAARFAERPEGAFTLWIGEREAVRLVRQGTEGERLALKAARRGRAGFAFLSEHGATLARAHPMLGLLKGLYKGNIPQLLAELMRRGAIAALGLSAGWLLYELLRLAGRWLGPRPRPAPSS